MKKLVLAKIVLRVVVNVQVILFVQLVKDSREKTFLEMFQISVHALANFLIIIQMIVNLVLITVSNVKIIVLVMFVWALKGKLGPDHQLKVADALEAIKM